jgi:hypothetical protein
VSPEDIRLELLVEMDLDLGTSFVLQAYDDEDGVIDRAICEAEFVKITYGGDTSVGISAVFPIRTNEHVESEQSSDIADVEEFENWAPISDIQAVDFKQGNPRTSRGLELYATTGQHETGAVTQFRYGIRASVLQEGPSKRKSP